MDLFAQSIILVGLAVVGGVIVLLFLRAFWMWYLGITDILFELRTMRALMEKQAGIESVPTNRTATRDAPSPMSRGKMAGWAD